MASVCTVWGYLWVLSATLLGVVNSLRIQVVQNDTVVSDFSDSNAIFQDRSYLLPNNQNDAIIGPLTYPNPRNACEVVSPPPNGTFIAFLEEYSLCPASSDANIKNAGFAAMLAYSKDGNTYLSRTTYFPQALIMDAKFADYIINNILPYSNTSDPKLVVIWDDSFSKLEELFIIFGSILLVVVILSLGVFCSSLCCRVVLVRWRTRGLSHWQVRALPKRKYRKKKETMETCSICLEEFKEGDTVRVLPCNHVFHPKCVDEWLHKWNRTCPLCKSTIKRTGGRTQHPPAQTDDNETSLLLPQDERPSLISNESYLVTRGNRNGSAGYGGTNELSPPSRANSSSSGAGQDSHVVTADIELSLESGGDGHEGLHSSNSIYHTPQQSDDDDGSGMPSYATACDSHEIGV